MHLNTQGQEFDRLLVRQRRKGEREMTERLRDLLYHIVRRQIPEFESFATEQERRAVFRIAREDIRRSGRAELVFWVSFLVWVGFLVCVGMVIDQRLGPQGSIMGIAVGVVGSGLLTVIQLWLFRSRIQRSLRRKLVSNGVPICVRCGYDLRGQIEARCPECGDAFDAGLLQKPSKELEPE